MRLVEVLFHQITEADIKKVEASSNNAETGGGARDLRFSIRFKDCLDRFFPEVVTKDGKSEYKIGSFRYIDSSNHEQVITNVKYAFKPTASRPNEIRIAQINTLEFFRDMPVLSHDDGLLFMCFMRFDEGLPLAQYVTQKRSCAPKSSRKIAEAMARAIDETKGNSAVVFSVSLDWVKEAEMTIDNVAVLELLSKEKNVLLCGAPATGKTSLLNRVEELLTVLCKNKPYSQLKAMLPSRKLKRRTIQLLLDLDARAGKSSERLSIKELDIGISFAASSQKLASLEQVSRFPGACCMKRRNTRSNRIMLRCSLLMKSTVALLLRLSET